MLQQIIICDHLKSSLGQLLDEIHFDSVFVLTDEHTRDCCLPLVQATGLLKNAGFFTVKPGDDQKNLKILATIWTFLSEQGASRKSLMINLGGGMITDLGGFAASTFKRGIRFINIPTTLLAIVDASVGGKTGINFNGLKNEVGTFAPAEAVLIDSDFLKTLDRQNFLSGYAEMIKHSLLLSETEWDKIRWFDLDAINYDLLKGLLQTSIKVKEDIVAKDPLEKGLRKALNLGHTIGHAFESYSYETGKPVSHGYAVAWGLVCELYISFRKLDFEQSQLLDVIRFIKENYGGYSFDCNDYDRLCELILHDKKNEFNNINLTLLQHIGDIRIDQVTSLDDIKESFDFYREYFGC